MGASFEVQFKSRVTRVIGRLKAKYEKETGAKDDLKVLTQAVTRMELP